MTVRVSAALVRGALALCVAALAACDPPEPEPEPQTTASTGAEPDTEGAESDTGEPGSTTDTPGTTGDVPGSCSDATTQQECEAIGSEYFDCGWFPTSIVADAMTCEVVEQSGLCLTTSALDGCDLPEVDDACEGVAGSWFFRTLEDGSIELLPEPLSCGGPGDFEACPWHMEEPGTDDIAAACSCACAIAGS